MYDRLTICDTASGKLTDKGVFGDTGQPHLQQVSGLAYSAQTGALLRSAWKQLLDVIDPQSGTLSNEFGPASATRSVDAIAFAKARSLLIVVWTGKAWNTKRVGFWSWKDRTPLQSFSIASEFTHDIAINSDNSLIALPYSRHTESADQRGVLILDAATGAKVNVWNDLTTQKLTFIPNSELLIASDGGRLCFGSAKHGQPKAVLQVLKGSGEVAQVAVSPDGRFLAAGTSSGAFVWSLPDLLADFGLSIHG